VIDFFAKLFEVPAKEASHLLACAYGIQPYAQEVVEDHENLANEKPVLKLRRSKGKSRNLHPMRLNLPRR